MAKNELKRFIADARRRVAAGCYDTEAQRSPNGSLAVALMRPDAVIAELKPRSPSEGRLLQQRPEKVLDAYRQGGAAAVSVLTDGDHFDGHPDLLAAAHATGLPVLMKDFIIDERQVHCAAAHGASAVLLIERCFGDPADREHLVDAAHASGMDVLLEVHTQADWRRAQHSEAGLFGVNARDLDTLQVDPAAARQLIADIDAAGRRVVALSGICSRRERAAAVQAGADAVLVGTHLMRSPDPALWLKALRRPLAKVCGVTNEEDVHVAHDAGADLVGFVVGAPDSPRDLAPVAAQRLVDAARQAGLRTVLVTPHEDTYEVREWCRLVRPDWVQVHGFAADDAWRHSLGAIPVQVLQAAPPGGDADATLYDSTRPGSGATHDWQATATSITAAPGRFSLVAGGLAQDNAADAVAVTGAWGADASSRLESAPGRKDPQAVQAFVAAVQEAP